MDRITAARVFVEVVDRGSLSAAAESLDMSRAMASRYLAMLEEWLGARLLHRTTRRLSLTSAGEAVLPGCRQMLDIGDAMRSSVTNADDTPRGQLRVTCSTSFAHHHLAQAITDFTRQNAAISVDLLLLDRAVNLVEERVDLAVRITRELDPNLIARRLCACRSAVCATPAYLAAFGMPQRAEDLARHNCLAYSYFGKSLWQFSRGGEQVAVPVGGSISANESTVLLDAALAGAGIVMQPTYAVASLLRSGQLVRLLPDHEIDDMSIYCVYASRRQLSTALRALLDFLAERFGPEPEWDR